MRRLIGGAGALAAAIGLLAACAPNSGRYIDLGYFAPADLVTTENVVYGEAPALPDQTMPPGGVETLLLDVVMPRLDVDAETARPAILWIHGGGFRAGSKASARRWLNEWASRGYVAIGINYRLDQDNYCQAIQDGQPFPPGEDVQCYNAIVAAQHDAQAAVRWVRANAARSGCRPRRHRRHGLVGGRGHVGQPGLQLPRSRHQQRPARSLVRRRRRSPVRRRLPRDRRHRPGRRPVSYAHCTNDQAVDWTITSAGIDAARAQGLVADVLVWEPPESCSSGRIHGVDLMTDHRAEIDLAFTQFFYRHMGLSQTED